MTDEGTAPHGTSETGAHYAPPSTGGAAALDGVRATQEPRPPSTWKRTLLQNGLHGYAAICAVIPLFGLVAMLGVLFYKAWPAIQYNGWGFFSRSTWDTGNLNVKISHAGGIAHPIGASYGAFPFVIGTLESSGIAIVLGFPIAVGAAILIVEKLPRRPSAAIGLCLEVLAGIPSAVIGLWGLFALGPWLATNIYPALTHLPNVPILNIFRTPVLHPNGEGLLTGGIVLAAMIVPIIAATSRDLLRSVPETTKEGAEALGMTGAEAFWTVQARWIRGGVVGAAVLGLGRALGETIAIALVSGSSPYLASNIYASMSTIAAQIVTTLDDALGDPSGLAVYTLAELALILFVITLVVNIGARLIVKRFARGGSALPVGAGF
jgi:phosphate transport system permease protein